MRRIFDFGDDGVVVLDKIIRVGSISGSIWGDPSWRKFDVYLDSGLVVTILRREGDSVLNPIRDGLLAALIADTGSD